MTSSGSPLTSIPVVPKSTFVTMTPEPSDQYVQSFARGLSIITAFGAERPSMTLTELSEITGLTRATVRRFLHTLVELAYVRSDGKSFQLTPRVLDLGFSYLSSRGLPEIAQPHLELFSRETGESSSLSVLDGDDIVYLARAAVRRIMNVSISVGTRFPAYSTSMGRVMLAANEQGLHRDTVLQGRTPKSITSRGELEKILVAIREDGYSLVDEELEIGLRSLAVPVIDNDGRTTAAINVSVSSGSYSTDAMLTDLLPRLLSTAEAIGNEIR